jgi:hypothetical protein
MDLSKDRLQNDDDDGYYYHLHRYDDVYMCTYNYQTVHPDAVLVMLRAQTSPQYLQRTQKVNNLIHLHQLL